MSDIQSVLDSDLAGCRVRKLVSWHVEGPSDRLGSITTRLLSAGYRVESSPSGPGRFGLTAYAIGMPPRDEGGAP